MIRIIIKMLEAFTDLKLALEKGNFDAAEKEVYRSIKVLASAELQEEPLFPEGLFYLNEQLLALAEFVASKAVKDVSSSDEAMYQFVRVVEAKARLKTLRIGTDKSLRWVEDDLNPFFEILEKAVALIDDKRKNYDLTEEDGSDFGTLSSGDESDSVVEASTSEDEEGSQDGSEQHSEGTMAEPIRNGASDDEHKPGSRFGDKSDGDKSDAAGEASTAVDEEESEEEEGVVMSVSACDVFVAAVRKRFLRYGDVAYYLLKRIQRVTDLKMVEINVLKLYFAVPTFPDLVVGVGLLERNGAEQFRDCEEFEVCYRREYWDAFLHVFPCLTVRELVCIRPMTYKRHLLAYSDRSLVLRMLLSATRFYESLSLLKTPADFAPLYQLCSEGAGMPSGSGDETSLERFSSTLDEYFVISRRTQLCLIFWSGLEASVLTAPLEVMEDLYYGIFALPLFRSPLKARILPYYVRLVPGMTDVGAVKFFLRALDIALIMPANNALWLIHFAAAILHKKPNVVGPLVHINPRFQHKVSLPKEEKTDPSVGHSETNFYTYESLKQTVTSEIPGIKTTPITEGEGPNGDGPGGDELDVGGPVGEGEAQAQARAQVMMEYYSKWLEQEPRSDKINCSSQVATKNAGLGPELAGCAGQVLLLLSHMSAAVRRATERMLTDFTHREHQLKLKQSFEAVEHKTAGDLLHANVFSAMSRIASTTEF